MYLTEFVFAERNFCREKGVWMKKTLSLKKSSDFQIVLKKGTWSGGKVLSIYIMQNKKNTNLLGIAVGKKGLNSVQRNRIKRLIRESYRNIES